MDLDPGDPLPLHRPLVDNGQTGPSKSGRLERGERADITLSLTGEDARRGVLDVEAWDESGAWEDSSATLIEQASLCRACVLHGFTQCYTYLFLFSLQAFPGPHVASVHALCPQLLGLKRRSAGSGRSARARASRTPPPH